ncbi:class I adenylate-forming enzyme family protein [Rhodopirellula sp. MGV]|uniref:class I adenylate-forming enzyme family protein n=1 Tax=Rhodopirellula sp. MGV TaxID=2023130 RepID=UPI000B96D276|nr:class I adenylate-forming enzyme family protein [Rhodopirellula sp. MGV]OYP31155.1 hypothetical protein CGZ80_21440 [Rhodopirellula sp. MGV]PNY36021.1 long-chain fatty acid--CoA ligase [Rhodopirellula baltica]
MPSTKNLDRLDDALRDNATKYPNQLALWTARTEFADLANGISWSQLDRFVTNLAHQLSQTIGSAQGDKGNRRMVHAVTNSIEDVLVALACARAGLVEVPIDAAGGEAYVRRCREKANGFWIDHDLCCTLIAHATSMQVDSSVERPAIVRPDPNADALILWTSGSSGDPKGVVLSHKSLYLNAHAKLGAAEQDHSDRRLTVLSISHAYARTCDLGTWLLSACTLAITRGYDGWLDVAPSFQPTVANVVPSLAERLLHNPIGCDALQMLGCGGAALNGALFDAWTDRGVCVIQGYGLTETAPVISSQTRNDSIVGHAGALVESWEYRIDASDRLFVRGPCQMKRYLDDPIATASRINADGWLDTGDVVKRCEVTGQLRILGRADDRLVLTTGHTVDPLNLEKRVTELSGVKSAVVTAAAGGRKLILWIESDEPDAATMKAQIDAALAGFPTWERPSLIRTFTINEAERAIFFNHKGTPRRRRLLAHLGSQQ